MDSELCHNTLTTASYMSVQKPRTAADILDAVQTQNTL